MELPSWINKEDWDAFLDMRKKIKSPMTDRAKEMAINALYRMMRQGEDPSQVLRQSEYFDWKGLFPLCDTYKQMNGLVTITNKKIADLTDRSWATQKL